MEAEAKWFIDEHAYQRWLQGREDALGAGIPLGRASVKNAICLALLENPNRYLSYQEFNRTFRRRGLFWAGPGAKGSPVTVPLATLRVAVSELSRSLLHKGHYLEVRAQKVGKSAQFALVDRHRLSEKEHGLLHALDEPLVEPRDISRGLVRDGGALPFASLYASYRAASQWLCFSSVQSTAKRDYESGAFDAYQLDRALGLRGYGGELGYVSLGTGEGLGEVALLNRLLRDPERPRPRRIHYAAIDTSEFLLTSHSHLVRERFAAELAEGRLVYVPLVGDLFQLQKCLAQVRYKAGKDFLRDQPMLFSYFGNCLGNYESHEWDFFRSVLEGFPTERLSILLGISLLRRKDGLPVEENYTLDPFLLETPRHLMYDLELLQSEDERGKAVPLVENEEFRPGPETRTPVPSLPYNTPYGIQGRVYRFYYTLRHDLLTWDGQQKLKRGNRVLLYSIIKYDLQSLIDFLRQREFEVQAPPVEYGTQKITEGEEEFLYGVIAVSRNPGRGK